MRKFQVTVNGNIYEVEVEELQGEQSTVVTTPKQGVSVPKSAPVAKPVVTPKKTATNVPAGATKLTSPMPGTIIEIKVSEGQEVKEGDVVAILEAMKMENEVVAPASGKVTSVNVNKGASVDSGDVIITIG